MARTDYYVTVVDVSRELSAKEKVMLKDVSDAIPFNSLEGAGVVIKPSLYAELSVHNEHAKDGNVDYPCFLVIDEDGTKYKTGSKAFWDTFSDIMADMANVTDEEWAIKVYKKASADATKQPFITCSLI